MRKPIDPALGPINGPGQYARRAGQYLSPWTAMLKIHLERMAMSQADLARASKDTTVRINQFLTGFCGAPVGPKLDEICKALKLEGTELEAFREEALLANSPPEVRDLVKRLRKAAHR